jgi:hypothetical protein
MQFMKIPSKIKLVGSLTVLMAVQVASAQEEISGDLGVIADCDLPLAITVELAEPEIIQCEAAPEMPSDKPEIITVDEPEEGVEVTGEPDVTEEVTEIPLDWIKRGDGENPDVIFYNMAGGPAANGEGGGVTQAATLTQQDEQTTVVAKPEKAVTPQVEREKSGPVALVNEGRVFLR